ncbi:MAG: membrane protein insertion efficiency factor YidD [Candidatus Marinimicrobia bacterium]|nr:membrane protein insertion efficiency factor YidD [Candidatus Neomarinimicrobiota bacterium]|tara:strand:- start:778 stop:1005 length:228 start_codon:yes stop_codon:yes gene_type:complete
MLNFVIISLLVFPIKIYQKIISPFLGHSCRFLPTCSEYSIIALEKHGIFRGTFLSLKRILKCNPFGSSGCDPVPD